MKNIKYSKTRIYHILVGGIPNFSRQAITSISLVLMNKLASNFGSEAGASGIIDVVTNLLDANKDGNVIKPIDTAANPLKSNMVNPNVANTAGAPNNQTTTPTQLGNVANGANTFDPVDGKKLGNDGNSGKNGSNRGNINRKAEDSGSSKVRNLEKISKKSSKNDDNEQKRNNEKDKEKNINVCNEGKDFTVSYNPNLSYPIAARRLGNKGVVTVSVKFYFNSSGSVSVISASRGSAIFQQEARKATSKIRVKAKIPVMI